MELFQQRLGRLWMGRVAPVRSGTAASWFRSTIRVSAGPGGKNAATGRFAEGGSKEQVGRILFHGLNRPEPADQRAFRARHPQSDRSQSTRSKALY